LTSIAVFAAACVTSRPRSSASEPTKPHARA
jgi:hypothetical protein